MSMTRKYKLKRENNNMDAMRYILAMAVIISHFNILCGHDIPFFISSSSAVGNFFALSGFLVFGSYRKYASVKLFFESRARRILPPYFFIVILCAIGLSTISTLKVNDYFTDLNFWKYIGANISFLNFLHPTLPGVFDGDIYFNNAVNGSLWTMKVEWILYASVPIITWIGTAVERKIKNGMLLTILLLMAISSIYKIIMYYNYETSGKEIYLVMARQVFGQFDYFYCGALIYIFFDSFIKNLYKIAILAFMIIILQEYIPFYGIIRPIIETTMMLSLCMTGKWGSLFSHTDNISYDMYLFHYPIMQIAVFSGLNNLGCFTEFIIVTVLTIVTAMVSWNYVGKRFIKRKLQESHH